MREVHVRNMDVGDSQVTLRSSGQGRPLLVLGDVFGPQALPSSLEQLARKHLVICPVHPGFDGGPRPLWIDTVADLAMAYLEILEKLDLSDVDLMGFGLGGWIAADLAVHNATRLRSLTLVGAHGLFLPDHPLADIFLQAEEALMRSWFADPALAEEAISRELAPDSEDLRLQNQELAARLAWEPRLHDPHLVKWLHRISIPALVVWGEQDEILPVAYALEWQKRLPRAQLTIMSDCGHAPQFERPDLFAEVVDEFLARIRC